MIFCIFFIFWIYIWNFSLCTWNLNSFVGKSFHSVKNCAVCKLFVDFMKSWQTSSIWQLWNCITCCSTCMKMDTLIMAWLPAHSLAALLQCLWPNVCLRKWASILAMKWDMPSDLKTALVRFVTNLRPSLSVCFVCIVLFQQENNLFWYSDGVHMWFVTVTRVVQFCCTALL